MAFKGLENHLPDDDSQALASSFQTAATKALEYLEEAAASTPTAPAACIQSEGHEGLEPLESPEGLETWVKRTLKPLTDSENLEGQREP